jgi:hypothetical protein
MTPSATSPAACSMRRFTAAKRIRNGGDMRGQGHRDLVEATLEPGLLPEVAAPEGSDRQGVVPHLRSRVLEGRREALLVHPLDLGTEPEGEPPAGRRGRLRSSATCRPMGKVISFGA